MKKLRNDTYLIEGPLQFNLAVDAILKEENEHSKLFKDDYSVIATDPGDYPYVVVFELDTTHETLTADFVTLHDFVSLDPVGRRHLYEFQVRKTMLSAPYTIRESEYQMPAKDLVEAIFKMGQIYHNDEEYLFEILNWNQVR